MKKLGAMGLIGMMGVMGYAASVRLAWEPSPTPGVIAYRVYYGPEPGFYHAHQVFTNSGTNTVTGLAHGATYYFAATAVHSNGLESEFTAEVWTNTPPAPPVNMRIVVTNSLQGAASPAGPWTNIASSVVSVEWPTNLALFVRGRIDMTK